MSRNARFTFGLFICLFVVLVFGSSWAYSNALDDYVARSDPSYKWNVVSSSPGPGFTYYTLNMISQTWRSDEEVNRTQWQHWIRIAVPMQIKTDTALLVISGGSNGNDPPEKMDKNPAMIAMAMVAMVSKSIVAVVEMIPNEPLTFTGETRQRSEDAIIAYSWDKYLHGGDESWILQLPMTKSAVRAMDAVQEFCETQENVPAVKQFVVAGASKRGWTTWLTAAVDKRVRAIMPIVIDMLNTEKSFRHHFAAYGFWAPAVHDYEEMGIFKWFGKPRMNSLLSIVDPYTYRKRFKMPKFILNSAGDDFFLGDSSQFYFDELPEKKHLRYVPNTNHSLGGSDFIESLAAYYSFILADKKLPRFEWSIQPNGSIRVKPIDEPVGVNVWQASNADARDFRLTTIGKTWTASKLTAQPDGYYVANPEIPQQGWKAFFVELLYDSGIADPSHPGKTLNQKFTTSISILPDTLPHIGKLEEISKTNSQN
ncbi:MAG: PhoPQ-activated pathogenicity-related family protein [Sedimentisphaerales bacterium]|nr:PhoPQ-activated pathogenicity-related family protein [Sedimentisphaerales bacterium]